jgi:hypothetical protein
MALIASTLFQMTIYLAVGSCPYCDAAYETTIKIPGTGRRAGFW